jgi:hypothetical protein
VHSLHSFHLNQIQDWNELDHLHFHIPHFNQLWFHEVLKFFVYHVFQDVNHFHQFHLNQIHNGNELNHLHFNVSHFNQLRFREKFVQCLISRTLLIIHRISLLHWPENRLPITAICFVCLKLSDSWK